jgi:hypothetical protein
MKNEASHAGLLALEQLLQREAVELKGKRSPHLAGGILQAIEAAGEPEPADAAPRVRFQRWPMLAAMAAAALALMIFAPRDGDPAHPKLLPSSEPALAQAQPGSGIFVDQLRGMLDLGQAFKAATGSVVTPEELIEREARLVMAEVTSMATEILTRLPIAGLPSTWQARFESL